MRFNQKNRGLRASDPTNALRLGHYGILHKKGAIEWFRLTTEAMAVTASPVVRTLRSTAPEQLKLHSKYTLACDVYSVGIVLWDIAAGKIAYRGEAAAIIKQAVQDGERLDMPADVPEE